MGMMPKKRCSSGNGTAPDPKRWLRLASFFLGDYTALKLQYHGCTNREGVKILVYKVPIDELMVQLELDPHFGDPVPKKYFPIARFEPSEQGWEDAMTYVTMKHGTRRSECKACGAMGILVDGKCPDCRR